MQRFSEHFGSTTTSGLTWASCVNSYEEMVISCSDPGVMLIESDVLRCSEKNEPIMAHPPVDASDLDFPTWMGMAMCANKGMKIDFKDPCIVTETIDVCIKKMREVDIKCPIILNADVLRGPGGGKPKFDALEIIRQSRRLYPDVIVSLGWTTELIPEAYYTKDMMDEMIDFVRNHVGDMSYTLPIRASYARCSEDSLEYLMQELPDYHLTIWNHSEQKEFSAEDMEWMRNYFDLSRVTYDLG